MGLLNRQKHKLLDIIAPAYPLQADAVFVLSNVGINPADIDIDGSSNKRWSNIIEFVKESPQFSPLLEFLTNDYPNRVTVLEKQQKLKSVIDEIYKHSPEHLIALLTDIIPKGDCVLFLGPDAFKCIDGSTIRTFNQYLAKQLVDEKLKMSNIFFEESTNLGYLIDRYESRENASIADTKAFAAVQYTRIEHNANLHLYQSLARLNFKLILNTNPDLIFGKDNPDFVRLRYDQSNNKNQLLSDDLANKKIIYNIYGSFDNPQSVLFTEKEAVTFTKGAYEKNPPILQEVKNIVKQSYGLFIGFDFKEWPLKILFDVLDLKNKPGNFSANEESIEDQYLEYYAGQYNMTFVTVNANFFDQL